MRNVILHILMLGTLPMLGCVRGDVDLLEARLRSKDAELRALNDRLESTERQLASSRREKTQLQQQLARNSAKPEEISRLAKVEGIEINPRLTGSLNEDDQPGDDVLNVVVSPVDASGEVVKLDGRVEVEAIDPSLPESERKLGQWAISLEDSAQQWHDGFLGQGFQLTTPWQRPPQSREIVLLARYTTPDGRKFSTTQEITVTPPGGPGSPPNQLPLPLSQDEQTETFPEIRPVDFEQPAVPSKPFPTSIPKITPAPKVSSPTEPRPLPSNADLQPIPLNDVLKSPLPRETPPFAE